MPGGKGSQQHCDERNDQPAYDHDPAAVAFGLSLGKDGRPGAANERQRGDRDQRLADANQHVNADHCRQHQIQRAGAAESQQQRDDQSGNYDRQPGTRAGENHARTMWAAGTETINRVGNQPRDGRHDQDIGSHGDETTVLKHERLHRDDGRHGQHAEPRAQHDEGQCSADKMPRRSTGNREVEHLGREDEGGHDAGQGHQAFVKFAAGGNDGNRQNRQRQEPAGERDEKCQETVRDMEQDTSR